MDKPEKIFAQGFRFTRPATGAPDFVKGKMSVNVKEAIEFLTKYQDNGWVNLDLLKSQKEGNPLYFQLNQWKKPEGLGDTKEKKTPPQPVLKPTGVNSDGSPVPNFDIEAEEVFNSWNDRK